MSSESNLKAAQQFLDAISGHDRELMASVCHPEFVWTLIPRSMGVEPMHGDEAINLLTSLGNTAFKAGSLSSTVTRSVATDDTAVLEVNVKGETAGGKTYDNWYCTWFEYRDGLIHRFYEHTDSKYAAEVMAP